MIDSHAVGPPRLVDEPWTESTEDLYDNAPCGYVSNLANGTIGRVNKTFQALTGFAAHELVGRRRFQDILSRGGQLFFDTHLRPLLDAAGAFSEMALDVVRADGTRLPVLVNASVRIDAQDRPVYRFVVIDASERRQYERELLAARQTADQLARFSAMLAAATTPDEMLSALSELAESALGASRVWLALLDDKGHDLSLVVPGTETSERIPLSRDCALTRAFRAVGPLLLSPYLHDPAVDETEAAESPRSCALAAIGLRSRACDGALGVACFGFAEEQPDGLRLHRLLETVGVQTSQALERAALVRQQRTIALRLQRALLPAQLARHPALEIAAAYRAAADGMEVGGDWYDTVSLDGNRVGFVVGDVVGHGLEAAASMGRLRSAFAAVASTSSRPGGTLDLLEAFNAGQPEPDFLTACYALLDPSEGVVRYASAGHLPPLHVAPDGEISWLEDGRSGPLYRTIEAPRPEAACSLAAGSLLLLYSDGLVERRDRPLGTGLDLLARAAHDLRHLPAREICEHLIDDLTAPEQLADDIVVLCVRLAPEAPHRLHRRFRARPDQLREIRADLRDWLDRQGVAGHDRNALLLLVGEASTNAVEHAYQGREAGILEIQLALAESVITGSVRDTGRWRLRSAASRGAGVPCMRALARNLTCSTGPQGTIVTFSYALAHTPRP